MCSSDLALWSAVTAPGIGLCIAVTFVQVLAFALMESTFTLYAERAHNLDAQHIGRFFGLVGIIGIVIQGGLIGRLVKRFGERPLVPIGLTLIAVGVVLLALTPTGAPMALTFAVLGIGQSITTPSLQSLISRSAAATEQGAVLGSAQSISALARAVGPAVGGLLFGLAPRLPFFSGGALLLAGAALAVPATARAVAAIRTGH